MKKLFLLVPVFVFLFLGMATYGLFGQAPEVSLDDDPSAPLNGPAIPPFMSAEDEFGLGLPAALAGFIGGSPTLTRGFYDSDVLMPGPALFLRFNPVPPMGSPFYVDAYSSNHAPKATIRPIFIRFSVDRATGGLTPNDGSFIQALNNEQPGDIFTTTRTYANPNPFTPLPFPVVPPWLFFYGGPLPGGPAGAGGNNILLHDHFNTFGFLPPPAYPPIAPVTHDNIDAYNEWPCSLAATDIYYALHPASAVLQGFSAADILLSPGGALNWPPALFAPAPTLGLDTGGPNTDSVDGLCVWDFGIPGNLDPGQDIALFTLAPGSNTLYLIQAAGYMVTAGDILITDFQGFFYIYLYDSDLGVANSPIPPLPFINRIDVNVDALDIAL